MGYLNCIKASEVNKHGLLKIISISRNFTKIPKPLKAEEITENLFVKSNLIPTIILK